ncbi:MAG: RNA polymerase sigma factor [Acidimicrobiaceae bacterium]|nr:RNA polymerase sigma factor [Acidimicrobiaceae bacterium]MYA84937.1 RNA polymerase sigma factor [Acidimicrobiaceae bacterium]MYE09094.1 RNA polymerase sigma factor [Acidimicrobiaceae bacterium]MYH76982.1 RNA polymerase sigma factor [Acidimicrobiaceae bacterium]MYI35427.1 RNA polymerase sigma factor [Acidimicrobiaceae bacterium]
MDTNGVMGVEAPIGRDTGRDRDWFTSLYHDSYRMLLAYARRRVDEQTADEVVADTFLVAWRRRDEVPEGFERAWLFGVARNTILTANRTARRRHALNGKLHGAARTGPWTDDRYETSDRADALLPALQALREEDREILMLVAWEGLSHAEIGEAMGISANAVAIRVHRARKRLTDRIDSTAVHCGA